MSRPISDHDVAASSSGAPSARATVLAALAQQLIARQAQAGMRRPLVVGISGAYTSGKTRLADDLAAALQAAGQPVCVLNYDDFHRPLASLTWDEAVAGAEVETFYARAFDAKRLCALVLAPLAATGALHADLHVLDWAQGQNVRPLPRRAAVRGGHHDPVRKALPAGVPPLPGSGPAAGRRHRDC
ncbi:hypothetical protein [Lacticaseibacillus kribbianus]|uniref:hypothetical protein n=1 Tax=Lacticaseibacillus kribbianus TaxID=2926292 RepID=UPI001CD53110|nr:hypothetical protein [Lacticaseibacillus kribbianus]